MIINKNNTKRNISAKITLVEKEFAKAYIQGAVHSHCNNSSDMPLSVRILFGNENRNWSNTPLQCIYNYYKYIAKVSNPTECAAKDVGYLFKNVLIDDTRNFKFVGKDTGNKYFLTP